MENKLSAQKKDTIKLTGIMSFSAIIGKIFHIPSSIVTAKFLGPSLLGVLAIINLIKQYVGYSHLGLLQSLPRDVPIAYGKGDKKEARLITDTVYTGFFAASIFSVLVLWILFALGITFKGVLNIKILILVSFILIANRINTFLRAYVKAEGKFMIIGNLELILRFSPLLTIPAVILLKLNGALLVILLSEVTAVGYYLIRLKRPKFNFLINIKKTLQLLKTGFMIFINGISDSIFWSIDLIILSALMTTREVGLYSIALAALRIVEPFSQAINMTVYRKMMVEGGKFGVSKKKHFRKYTEGLFVNYLMFNSILLGLSILLYMMAIRTILTKYTESLSIMIILMFGYIIFTSRVFLSFYMNVTNQLKKRLIIIMTGLGLNALLDYFLIVNGYGTKGVAFACSFSFIFISSSIIIISLKQIYETIKSSVVFLIKIFSISAILTGIIIAFSKWYVFSYTHLPIIHSKILWGSADLIVKGLIYSISCIGIYFLLFNNYRLYDELRPIVPYVVYLVLKRLKIKKSIACSKT